MAWFLTFLALGLYGVMGALARNWLIVRNQTDWRAHVVLKVGPTLALGLFGVLLASFANAMTPAPDGGGFFALMAVIFVLFALGDLFLIFDGKRAFYLGLISFLLGHVAVILALRAKGAHLDLWAFGPMLAVGLGLLFALRVPGWPMRGAVFAYIAVISAMVGHGTSSESGFFLPLFGAVVLFAFSDSVLAWRKFRGPFPGADLIVWNSYWVSIAGLAIFLPVL